MNTPLVSIIMPTYNHEKYIRQAIESVLVQECNFSYQLLIGEDFSTDKTREICQSFADLYPDKIILLPSYKNLGLVLNYKQLFDACNSKYVAILEGDDYWTNENKLQMQIDIMENNEDIGLVHTRTCSLYENGNLKVNTHLKHSNKSGHELFKEYYLDKYSIVPLTVCFRKKIFNEYVDYDFCIENQLSTIDNFIFPEMMIHTKFHFINQITGHYRVLSSSVSNNVDYVKNKKWLSKIKITLDYFTNKYPLQKKIENTIYNNFYITSIKIGLKNNDYTYVKKNVKNIVIKDFKTFYYYFIANFSFLHFIFILEGKTIHFLSKSKQFFLKLLKFYR